MTLQPSIGPWPLLQSLDHVHIRQDSMDEDQPDVRPLRAHRINTHIQASMLLVGFEPTILLFEGAATVIGL
jgi:hypothetical protein